MQRALITGIAGQDGSYLAELLLSKGYEVHGIVRRASSFNTGRLDHIYQDPHESGPRLQLHYGDLTDSVALVNLIRSVAPSEVYHLGAQSHVKVSFEIPEYTGESTGLGTIRLLEAIRASGVETRFYQASSSEMFGSAPPPQDELTPFHPRSPYGCAKVYAYWTTVNYREAYGLHAVNGILFNHESPRRGETFVTRKVTRAVARIRAGLQDRLYLGNLQARRDWGYAPEYVEAMWRMLQQHHPGDYVIATGESHTDLDAVGAQVAAFALAAQDVTALLGVPGDAQALVEGAVLVGVGPLDGLAVELDLDRGVLLAAGALDPHLVTGDDGIRVGVEGALGTLVLLVLLPLVLILVVAVVVLLALGHVEVGWLVLAALAVGPHVVVAGLQVGGELHLVGPVTAFGVAAVELLVVDEEDQDGDAPAAAAGDLHHLAGFDFGW